LYINDINIKTSIDKGLVIIAKNCNKVKEFSLVIGMRNDSNILSFYCKLFHIICEFQTLISCEIVVQIKNNFLINDSISCESPKVNQSLKHLSLEIPQLSDKYFENINIFLPQLIEFMVDADFN
jgi:hypothetical protein